MREAVVVSVVRRCREKYNVVSLGSQFLGELITLGLVNLVSASGGPFGVGTALVGLINNHEVPSLLPNALSYVLLLGVVNRSDHLVAALPGIRQLLLVHR